MACGGWGLESKVVAENVGNDVVGSDSDEDEEAQGSESPEKDCVVVAVVMDFPHVSHP